jgi:hypothetical protein
MVRQQRRSGEDPGTDQAFWNKMKASFVHDANNGRPDQG